MKIYVEQLIITNFIIDFCILIIISKLVLSKPNYKHITLSSFFGSVSALVLPFCFNAILINALKILTSIIMLQLLHIRKKQLFLSCALMLGISYIIGGAILSNFGTPYANGYALNNINLVYVFGITLTFTFLTIKLMGFVKSKVLSNSHIFDTTLIYQKNKIKIKSFIDSGNALTDSNNPVSIINFETFSRLTNIDLSTYLTNDFSTLINPHFIEANTIAGKKKILVFTINELHLNKSNTKIFKDVRLGVSLNFDNTKEYKAILNSYFCLN